MKKILTILFILSGFVASAQTGYTLINSRYKWLAGLFDALGLPAGGNAAFTSGQAQRAGSVYYDSTGSDAGFYIWTGTAWVLQGTPTASELPDELISGGQVTYSGTGLKFYISPAVYRINGVIYGTAYDSVTLSTADPTDPRKDVIYLATTGVEVKTGTPAGPAAEPQMDIGEIKLTVIDIQAAATTPSLTTNVLWDENTESVVTNIGTTTDADNLTNVYHLTKSVNVTSINSGDAIIFTLPSTIDLSAYNSFSFFLKLKAVLPAGIISINFYNGSNAVTPGVSVSYNKNSTGWQGISIATTRFTSGASNTFIDKVRITFSGVSANQAGFYLDYLTLVSGFLQPGGGSGTTLAMAPVDSNPNNPNGGTISNGLLNLNRVTNSYSGLMTPELKAKLDSLRNYFLDNVGDGAEILVQVNDSTAAAKTIKPGTNITLDETDTTITVNATAGSQTLQQTFDQEVGGSVLTKIDTISTNNTIKIIGSTTSFAELLRVENSSTTGGGIVASTAGTNATIRAINNKTTSGGGTAILGEAYGSNATGALTRDSSSTATVIKVLDLNRTTSGSAANGIGGAIHFNVENSSANTFFANSVESIWKNSIDANKESMLRIRGVNNTVEEVYMDIQKGGIVIVNNGADTLAKLSDLTGGGSYTDADARAAISLTTTGSSGAATYNSGTGVFNIPDYSSGTSIWNGTVIGTSFSATSTTISSAALQWTFTGSVPQTFTLPPRTSSVNQFYTIKNIGSADLTVAADGTDDIFTTTSVSSLIVVPGGSVMITGAANGTSDLWTALFHSSGTANSTGSLRIDRTYGGIQSYFIRTSDTTLVVKDIVGVGTDIEVTTLTDSTNQIAAGANIVKVNSENLGPKRWVARVGSTTSSATPTINTDNVDIYKLTAQTADITSFTTNLSGTPVDGDILEIQVTGTAARAITWGASFVASTVPLPTTTVTTATLTTVFQYFTTSSYGNNKWVCVNSF